MSNARQAAVAVLQRSIAHHFHKLFYASGSHSRVSWLGVPTLKCPFDLWIYQEILCELRPAVVVETGTYRGGSALFLASLCDLLEHGQVVTVDVDEREGRPRHPRIHYLTGSSTGEPVVASVRDLIAGQDPVMVILDSDHHKDHVLAELRAYGPLVTPGSYLIVEDTNLNGHPVWPHFGPGPMEAVREFLRTTDLFAVDPSREKLHLTYNPRGYLKRVR